MRQRRRRKAADDRRGFVDERVVRQRFDHEQGIVHAAGEVAGKDGIAYVATPHGQSLTPAFLEVASAHDRPACPAGKYPAARFHLIVKIYKRNDPCEPAGDLFLSLQGWRDHVLAIACDMPAAGKK